MPERKRCRSDHRSPRHLSCPINIPRRSWKPFGIAGERIWRQLFRIISCVAPSASPEASSPWSAWKADTAWAVFSP